MDNLLSGKRYINSFQGMRWLMALAIFLFHCGFILDIRLPAFEHLGPIGVSFFFILSGFLNQMKFSRGGERYKNSLFGLTKRSFLDEAKKFFPLHWITLIIAVLLDIGLITEDLTHRLVILFLNSALLQAWIPEEQIYYSFNSGAWFLSVMIFWSVLSPLVTKIISKLKKTSLFAIIIIVLMEIFLAFIVDSMELDKWLVYICPLSRMLDMISGCLLFQFIISYNINFTREENCILMIISFLILTFFYISEFIFSSAVYSAAVWNLPVLGVILSLAEGDEKSKIIRGVFGNKIAVYLGKISFEFYLFHQLVLRFGNAGYHYFKLKQDIWLIIISFLVTLLISIIYHQIYIWISKRLHIQKKADVPAESGDETEE